MLSDAELEEAIKSLPLERKRRLAMQLSLELAEERRKRQGAFYEKLRAYARARGVDWESLSPTERIQFVLQYREDIFALDEVFVRYQNRAEAVLREAAAQRGKEWDTMNDEERATFVAEWIED